MQTHEFREYAESRRGWTVAAEYVDAGISGTKEKQPELGVGVGTAYRAYEELSKIHPGTELSRNPISVGVAAD